MTLRPASRYIILLIFLEHFYLVPYLKCAKVTQSISLHSRGYFSQAISTRFACSLKPVSTTLSESLHAVHNSAEVGSAQRSVVVYRNLQLEEHPKREACEYANITSVSLMRIQQTHKPCMVWCWTSFFSFSWKVLKGSQLLTDEKMWVCWRLHIISNTL